MCHDEQQIRLDGVVAVAIDNFRQVGFHKLVGNYQA
jgi:hypothetical protein